MKSVAVKAQKLAFAPGTSLGASAFLSSFNPKAICAAHQQTRRSRYRCPMRQPRADATPPSPDDIAREEQAKTLAQMRARLEGLFGNEEDNATAVEGAEFDGTSLRNAILERWGVQYDVQPQKRHGRVYVQIMWRYFEQQSFYMNEDEFANHCEAVAQLLQKWNAVDYFCDYIASIKKRPVVGITINIPIPGVTADSFIID